MADFYQPPPRPMNKSETRTALRKIHFPTIQELVKKIPPPGSTPIGSFTDITGDDEVSSSNPPTSSDECHNYPNCKLFHGIGIGTEENHTIRLSKNPTTLVKDVNSNIIASSTSTLPLSEETQWENTGRTITPLTTARSSKHSRCPSSVVSTRTPSLTRSVRNHSRSARDFSPINYYDYEYACDASSGQSPAPRIPARVSKELPHLQSVIAELKEKEVVFDRTTAVHALKARILRGDRVTHDEIKALRHITLQPHHRHLGWRLPWSRDLYCAKGLVHIPTPNKPPPGRNTFGTTEDLRIPVDDNITLEHWGRRQYILNLAGFLDRDISLYLEGKNRLVIRAVRPNRNETPAMTVTETIILPPDLPADNLRIVRKPSGTTIIEESWRF